MEIKQIIESLETSNQFVEWKKKNPEAYLSHALNIIDNHTFTEWQLGYFQPKTQKITVFEIGETITISPESDVFKKEETTVKPLNIASVKIDITQVLETANNLKQSKYPQILTQKIIIILQNIDLGQLWNITFVSKTFEVLNMKISAENGKVLSHELKPLFEFKSTKDS